MTSIIRFTPLCGSSPEEPQCYLLEVDDVSILLDCGWETSLDLNFLSQLKKEYERINPNNFSTGFKTKKERFLLY